MNADPDPLEGLIRTEPRTLEYLKGLGISPEAVYLFGFSYFVLRHTTPRTQAELNFRVTVQKDYDKLDKYLSDQFKAARKARQVKK